jgi:hypothetical protein
MRTQTAPRRAPSDAEYATAAAQLDFLSTLEQRAGSEGELEQQILTCPPCGAQLVVDPSVLPSHCAFCTAPLASVTPQTLRRIRPRGLVPFGIEAEDARARFRAWMEGHRFAPDAVKRTVTAVDSVRGVYVPCWTFNTDTESDYTGQRGDSRPVTVVQRQADGREAQVTCVVTDWQSASGRVRVPFVDEAVLASHTVPRHLEAALSGWDIAHLVPLSETDLAGCTVEAYQVALEPAFDKARQRFEQAIERAVRHDIGGDEQRVYCVDTRYDRITFRHVLVPVWMASYRVGRKRYAVVVNGQTGVVMGDRPWSFWKIAGAVLAVAAPAAILWAVTVG